MCAEKSAPSFLQVSRKDMFRTPVLLPDSGSRWTPWLSLTVLQARSVTDFHRQISARAAHTPRGCCTFFTVCVQTIGSAGGFDYHRISYPGVIIFKKIEKWLHLYRLKFYRYRRIIFFAVFIVLVTSMTSFVLGGNKLISKCMK